MPPPNSVATTASPLEFRQILRDTLGRDPTLQDFFENRHLFEAFEQHAQNPPLHLSNIASESDAERRQRLRDGAEASPLFVLPPPPPAVENRDRAAAVTARLRQFARRGRPRMTSSDRYLERHRSITEGVSALAGIGELQQASRQLEAASSGLRALLDAPVPALSAPILTAQESEDADVGRRTKRRKLDADHVTEEFAGFAYGKHGQVETGKLKMEIVSCDGGIFQASGDENYSAENVLTTDATVYCTKSDRCNLVLRHQSGTAFELAELMIKAPHSGYTAPVQEGMVFVSMTSGDLLTRTAQYQIQYSSPRTQSSSGPNPAHELPPIISIRHGSDGTMTTAQIRARRFYSIGVQDEECDFRTAQIPSEFTANALPFTVTTECSDSEGETTVPRMHRARIRRLANARYEDTESEDIEDLIDETIAAYDENSSSSARARRRDTASNITLAEAAEASQIATQEAVKAVGGELMVPHARFFIERDKSKCTVRFDPPVTGRFILLKMWSPHHSPSGNIDIQSVVVKGYCGPRLFPAVSLR